MKLEIVPVADGRPYGTVVRNAETKEKIDGVRCVTWTHRAGEAPFATIEVICYKAVEVPQLDSENVKIVDVTPVDSEYRKLAMVETPA